MVGGLAAFSVAAAVMCAGALMMIGAVGLAWAQEATDRPALPERVPAE